MEKSVVIIGSGLGGLSTGVILARNGYRVTVLEQSPVTGGCLQCFVRGGAMFETGLHYIGSADPGQQLYRMLDYLGVMRDIRLSRLDPDGYNTVSVSGHRFRIPNGREAFIERLGEDFPAEKDNIARYYDTVTAVAESSPFYKFDSEGMFLPEEGVSGSMSSVIDSLVRDPLLREVLSGDQPLYAARRDMTPFMTHAFIFNFYNRSAFRVAGGSGTIAESMRRTIESLGGTVRNRFKVSRILCDDRHCTGVESSEGERVMADYVISSVHPSVTLSLLDTPLIRPSYRKRVAAIPNTVSCFAVYLRFKEGACRYMNTNHFGYLADSCWGCEDYDRQSWPKGYLYMHFCDGKEMGAARSGVILSYMWMRDVERWSGTLTGRRPQDYRDFKEAAARRLMSAVERDFPGLGSCVQDYWTSTPLTYRDYTGTVDGSMYGIERDVRAGISGRVSHRTRIPNLFLCGQSVNSHGTLGVLVGSIMCAAELVGMDNIFKQIKSV
ncbi:MAG TPA: NAD(P)/FAD-dependent oxidoreductase [Candidatus Coprenecus pullistercoris]|nr:NAD(P)/FAD-dependent oxidoreductase [Candidatus Coprenecus pullistercoris]